MRQLMTQIAVYRRQPIKRTESVTRLGHYQMAAYATFYYGWLYDCSVAVTSDVLGIISSSASGSGTGTRDARKGD